MVEKDIREVLCQSIYGYARANNKYMKDCNKHKESSYLQNWDFNNVYGWAMSLSLPVSNFEWIENTFQFNEDYVKSYDEGSDEGYFLQVDVQYLKNLHERHNNLLFLPEEMKI